MGRSDAHAVAMDTTKTTELHSSWASANMSMPISHHNGDIIVIQCTLVDSIPQLDSRPFPHRFPAHGTTMCHQ